MHGADDIRAALESLPGGVFAITAAYEDERSGCLVKSVQMCADEPLLVCVAVRKGHRIEPLIRDSHVFAVCRLDPSDKLPIHALDTAGDLEPEAQHDPFDSLPVVRLRTGSPVVRSALLALDCEVVRHFDMEADHELYIGEVVAVRTAQDTAARPASPSGDASAA